MQKLRRLNFFDRHIVKQEGEDVHKGIQSLNVACAAGGSQSLWLGKKSGEVFRLDRQFTLTPLGSAPVFDRELIELKVVEQRQLLICVGSDTPAREASGNVKYKVFDIKVDDEPVLLQTHRVFPPRSPDQRPTCLDHNPAFQLLAMGIATGVVHLWRGRDLAQEKPWPTALGKEDSTPVTAVHFLEQAKRTALFACSMASVRCWAIQQNDEVVAELSVDTSGGAAEFCSCIFPAISSLLVAKGEAIFAYDPDEGNMSAIPLEGDKVALEQFKAYFVSVTAESGASAFGTAVSPSAMPKHNVLICLAHPHMRFIAFQGQFTDVTHVITGMGSVFILSHGGADSNTVLFELREKDLSEQLDILVKKRMFEWAAEIGLTNGATPESIADIHKLHGDALFEKRAYDQALAVYTKTIDLGLPLEPSYIVERYLDAQRIGHVAKYLKRLHEKNRAEREHTALLLKCYTKLKDFKTLEEFLDTTPVSQYDPGTAISVLEAATYFGLACDIAKKVEMHDEYVRISLEHFKHYTQTVQFLKTLPISDASQLLLAHGRVLLRNAPSETIALIQEICGLTSGTTAEDSPQVDEFLPIFVDDLPQLDQFLRGILLAPGGSLVPHAQAERLYPTLLELMVRKAATGDGATAEPVAEGQTEQQQVLSDEIMRLIRQYSSEEALSSALMLCKTYEFVDGFFYAAEKLRRYQLLMNWCFEKHDAKRLVQVCKLCGENDQSLWVQALSFLAAEDGDHMEEIGEVLKHIEQSDLMPLLMVIETLQQNPRIQIDAVRGYLQNQFKKLSEPVEASRRNARQDRTEIQRMQQEIVALRTQAQVFQNTKCFQCGLTLEVPAVHFFCGHSYHSYCMPADGRCPKCSSEALHMITLKDQREAKVRNTEDFFKNLQGGGGEGGVAAMAEWCGFGAFDAGPGVGHGEQDM